MGILRRNYVQVTLHLVWNTKNRLPMIRADREEELYRCIVSEARKAGAEVLAINGMPDHVHVLLLFPTTIGIGMLVKQMKGVSSSLARSLYPQEFFQWAEGYGVFSVSRNHWNQVADYIRNQKPHHASGKLWMLLESPDAPVETCPQDFVAKPLAPDLHVGGQNNQSPT